eukprot:SAG22_NODE_1055_length_5789_cov_3.943234_2_plen_72_part_00
MPPPPCEDCGDKQPSYGLPAEGKRRWCGGCGKQKEGAVSLKKRKKCEDCGELHVPALQRQPFALAHCSTSK